MPMGKKKAKRKAEKAALKAIESMMGSSKDAIGLDGTETAVIRFRSPEDPGWDEKVRKLAEAVRAMHEGADESTEKAGEQDEDDVILETVKARLDNPEKASAQANNPSKPVNDKTSKSDVAIAEMAESFTREPAAKPAAKRGRKPVALKGGRKIFVIDTNVIMSDPDCFHKFDDNLIVIPDAVIEELDNHKGDIGDTGYNTRKACRELDALSAGGSEVPVGDTGGMLRFTSAVDYSDFPDGWDRTKPDNRILAAANAIEGAIIVSKDTNLRIKARILDIPVQNYRHEAVEEDYLTYRGRTTAYAASTDFKRFAKKEAIPVTAVATEDEKPLRPNEFVVLKCRNSEKELLGMVRGDNLEPLRYATAAPYGIHPRNQGQIFAMEALMAPAEEVPLVILTGSAGTAKTMLALACALEQIDHQELYRRVTIARANVEFDRDIGALPGSEEDKVGPLLRGCIDNLEQLVPNGIAGVERKFDEEIIKAEALGFLRGRTLVNQILFIDEAQNTSVSQMNGILTRCGELSKIVIAGDLNQIDTPRLDRHNNGLAHAIKLMGGDPDCCVVGFLDSEATRSRLAAKVAEKISQNG